MSTPSISSVSYNASTGVLTLTGSNLTLTAGSYKITDFKLNGDEGLSYQLTKGSAVSGTPTSTTLLIQLSAADQLAVDGLLNRNGVTANNGSSSYELSATAGWDSGAKSISSLGLSVSSVTAPTLSAASYNAATGVFSFTGANLSNLGKLNGLNISNFSMTGGNGSFSFDSHDVVSKLTASGFTVTLSNADKALVDGFVTLNGDSPLTGNAYNIAAKVNWDSDSGLALNSLAVTASGVAPTVSSVSYNALNGELTLYGNDFSTVAANYLLKDFSVVGDSSKHYQLTASSYVYGTITSNELVIKLSAADQLAVNGLLNNDGSKANDGHTSYALSAGSGWDSGNDTLKSLGITVSNVTTPTLSSAAYNATTGTFTFTGSNLTNHGGSNGIMLSDLKFSVGQSGSYTFNSGDAVSYLTANSFTITLDAADKKLVNNLANANGVSSQSGISYNLAATGNWDSNSISTTGQLAVTVKNVTPELSSISYNASTGVLTLNGSHLTANPGDYTPTRFALTGNHGHSYVLTSGSVVTGTPTSSSVSIQLSNVDSLAVDGLLDRDGNASLGGNSYLLTGASGWDIGATSSFSKAVTVNNAVSPSISSVSYNTTTGIFTFTGSHLSNTGYYMGLAPADFTFSVAGHGSYTLNAFHDPMNNFNSSGFIFTLSSADKTAVNALLNDNGYSNASSVSYLLNVSAGWDSGAGAAIHSEAVLVSGFSPTLSNVVYNEATGTLVLTGSNLSSAYTYTDISLSGDGGGSYTLTGGSLTRAANTGNVSIQLTAADQLAVDGLLNNNGATANDGNSSYNFSAVKGWDGGTDSISKQAVTVNNALAPSLTAVSFDAATGVFSFTGSNLDNQGGKNGIQLSHLQLSGGGGSYSFSSNDTVSNLNSTGFSVTLNSADYKSVLAFINANGEAPQTGAAYNLATTANWDSDSGAASSTLAMTVNSIPTVSAINYDAATGILSLTGSNLTTTSSDYNIADYVIQGDGGSQYTLSSGSTLATTPTSSSVSIQLSAADQLAVDGLLNQDGAQANSGDAYQLNLASGWDSLSSSQTIASLSVTNVTAPTISTVSYNATTGVFIFTGSELNNHGASGGINAGDYTISTSSGSYTFNTSNDLQGSLTSSGFTVTLSSADQATVNALLDSNGLNDLNGSAYNLAIASNWDSNAGAAVSNTPITVNNTLPQPALATVSYDTTTGAFTFTGSNLANYGSTTAIALADLTFSADTGSYSFTSSDVISNLTASGFTVTLSSADLTTVNALVTADGLTTLSGGAYNIAATTGWDTTNSQAITTQAVTAGGLPGISTASYDASTGQLSLSCSYLTGYTTDYTLTDFKISGDSGASYTLTGGSLSGSVSTGSLVIQLTAADELAVNGLLNADGTTANSGSSYNLAVSSGWDTHAPAITSLPITVSNITAPELTAVSYNANTGSFSFTGSNLDNAGTVTGIALTAFTLNDGAHSFSFNSTDSVTNLTSSGFTVTLGSTDETTVNAFVNANGSSSLDGYAYSLAIAGNWDSNSGAAVTAQPVSVLGLTPTINAINYNAATGILSLSGSNLSTTAANYKVSDLTVTGDGGATYTLSTSSLVSGTPTSNLLSIQLSAADELAIDGLLNRDGETANDNSTLYNLAAKAGWDSGSDTMTTQSITVSNVTAPSLSTVIYNAATGVVSFTGSNLSNLGNYAGINPSSLTLSSDTGSFTLNTSDSFGLSSASGFSITLSSADQSTLNALMNANGVDSASGGAYNLSAHANWDSDSGTAISTLAVSVTGLAPTISTVSYNAATGILSLSGSNFSPVGSSYNLADLHLSGDGRGSYALTSTSTIASAGGNSLNIQLSAADQLAVNGLLNHNGGTANDNATQYSLSASSGWDGGYDTLTAQSLTVSNVSAPELSTVAYNASTGVFTVTGSNLDNQGSLNGVNLSDFSLSSGSQSYSFSSSLDSVSNLSSSGFSISLGNADTAAVNAILNANGASSLAGQTYNLATTANWDSDSGAAISKLGISVNNEQTPAISGVSYNTVTGVLTVSGSNLDNYGTANSIALGNFALSGGGNSFTLSSKDTVSNLSATGFTVTLASADHTTVNAFMNADGLSPVSGAAYQLTATANWDTNAGAAISQAVTVNGVPTLSAASYNAATGILTLTGSYLTTTAGNYLLSDFSLTGDGANSYTLSSASVLAASPTSTGISIQLSTNDQLQLDGLLNKDGSTANDGVIAYALAAIKGWDSGAASITALPVTVSNVIAPSITGVTFNASSGVMVVTGSNLVTAGSNSVGINLANFSVNFGNNSYTLSSNDQISNFSSTSFTVTLSPYDLYKVNNEANNISNAQAYTLALASNWDSDFGAALSSLPISNSGTPLETLINSGLSSPLSIAMNNSGYLFIADTGNNAIKLLTSTGVYSVFSGLYRPEAIAINNNNLYISDSGANAILEEKSGTSNAIVLASSGLNNPAGLAVYNGNVYIADYGDSEIKEIVNGSNTVTKVLTAGLSNPEAIAFDSYGNLYISDSGDNAIKELSATTNTLTTIVSTGISNPGGITVDGHGNIFFTDSGNNAVKEIVAGTNTAVTLISSGLSTPVGITMDGSGNLYITETGNNSIVELVHTNYIFNATPTSGSVQTITNLWENTGQIQLSTSVFTALANQANVTAANFSNAASPTSSTDYLYYNSTTGGLYYEANGSAGKLAPVEIAIIGSSVHPAALSAGDFSLVA
jgi:hypothetical protein